MEFFSYIDPSTGSLFVQGAIGSILAISVVFRRFIRIGVNKLRLVFSRQKTIDEEV